MNLSTVPLRAAAHIFAVVTFAACLLALAPQARANNIEVEVLADVLAVDQVCTLREAIINANNDAATWPDCGAGSGVDTININVAGTITLAIVNTPGPGDTDQFAAEGDLDLNSSLIINGNPAGTVINANQLDRIFELNADPDIFDGITPPPIAVTLNNLTVTNGRQNDVGAVRVNANATATMNGCTVSNSHSWANDAGGVGVFSGGVLTMNNCTVSGNHALLLAGGVKNEGMLTLSACTISANFTDTTPTRGQGIGSYSTTVIRNTVVAGNSSGRPELEGFYTSEGYNIIGSITDQQANVIATITPAPGTADQIGVNPALVNLGPLASNGGPTPTHALGAGSIAIDAGHSFGLITDQRGLTRPCDLASVANAVGGDGSDSGAFEVQGACLSNQPAAPDAVDDNAAVNEDSGANIINVLANDTDANGDPLTIINATQGAHGSVVNNGNSVSYTPNPNYFGPDSFTYTISDNVTGTDTATVMVNVANVNDAPVANNDNYNMNQDTTLTVLPAGGVLANDTDIDGPTQTAVLDSGPTHAAAFGFNADGSFSYTPNPGFTGIDTFDYHVNDGTEDSNVATVTINVKDTQAPVVECSVTTALLWPPNSDLVNVGLSVEASDNDGEEPTIVIEVFSDEDDTEQVDGMSPDAKDVAEGTLRLRAERRGDADGRVYIIRIKATDTSNNVSYSYCTVVVPHSQSKADLNAVNAQAAAAVAAFVANGNNPPAGFFLVGDGPVIGPKQ